MAHFLARFYRIKQCGYYPFPATPIPLIGDADYLFEELAEWGKGRNLQDTRLPVVEGELPTYLMSVAKRAGCWVLVLWNEVPSGEAGVASVMGNSKVGRPVIQDNAIAAGSIPGFPTYFLCIPGSNLFATLKYGDRVNGLRGCKHYLAAFQEVGTACAVIQINDEGDVAVLGYRDVSGDVLNLHSRFQLQLIRSGTQRSTILASVSRIRKIVRVKEMDPNEAEDRKMYQKALDWIGVTEPPAPAAVRFKQEIEARPTREEVAEIIDSVIDEVEARVNDVGFVLSGQASPIWLSGSIPAETLELDVQEEEGAFGAKKMVGILSRRRDQIVATAEQ